MDFFIPAQPLTRFVNLEKLLNLPGLSFNDRIWIRQSLRIHPTLRVSVFGFVFNLGGPSVLLGFYGTSSNLIATHFIGRCLEINFNASKFHAP